MNIYNKTKKPPVAYIVSWLDKQSNKKSKKYVTHQEAAKAARWLANNNADDIDIAVVLS